MQASAPSISRMLNAGYTGSMIVLLSVIHPSVTLVRLLSRHNVPTTLGWPIASFATSSHASQVAMRSA